MCIPNRILIVRVIPWQVIQQLCTDGPLGTDERHFDAHILCKRQHLYPQQRLFNWLSAQ